MTKRELGALALKLMGIWLVAVALKMLGEFSGIVAFLDKSAGGNGLKAGALLGWFVPIVLLGVLIFVLFRFGGALGGRLFRNPDEEIAVSLGGLDLLAVGAALVGIVLIVESLPLLWGNAYSLSLSDFPPPSPEMRRQIWSSLWMQIFRVVVGVVLFVQARGLSALWHRLRAFDRYPAPTEKAN